MVSRRMDLILHVDNKYGTPFCFLRGIAGLIKEASRNQLLINPIALLENTNVQEVYRWFAELHIPVSRSLEINKETPWQSLCDSLERFMESDVACFVPSGTILTQDWLLESYAAVAAGGASLYHPQVGVLGDGNDWGYVDFQGLFTDEDLMRGTLLDFDFFPPTVTGARADIVDHLKTVGMETDLFSNQRGFKLLTKQGYKNRCLVQNSAFFLPQNLQAFFSRGVFSKSILDDRSLSSQVFAHKGWVERKWKYVQEVDPRANFGSEINLLRNQLLFRLPRSAAELRQIEALLKSVPDFVFVRGSDDGSLVSSVVGLLCQSFALEFNDRRVKIFMEHSDRPNSSPSCENLEIATLPRLAMGSDHELQALALAAVLSGLDLNGLHLIDSPLAYQVLRVLAQKGLPKYRVTYTLLPEQFGLQSLVHRLFVSEFLPVLSGVRFLSFDPNNPTYQMLKNYGLASKATQARWSPESWRNSLVETIV